MKSKISSIVMIIAAIAACARTLPAEQPQGPRIGIAEERVDLGRVVQGTRAEHLFGIRNEGDEALVIEQIKTS